MNKFLPAGLFILVSCYAHAQSTSPQEDAAKNKRTDNVIKKNLEAIQEPEEIEKIIIEGRYDPENLPKKKKTVEQKMQDALNPKASLADAPPIGYQVHCVQQCKGPFCCTWVPGPRSYLQPDTIHK